MSDNFKIKCNISHKFTDCGYIDDIGHIQYIYTKKTVCRNKSGKLPK
jgi:hypothetical protein